MSDNFLVNIFEALFVVAFVLALLHLGQYIPLVTNIFTFVLVDHIYGMIAGAIVGAFILPKTSIAGIPIGAILGTIVQYLLFR